MHAFVHARRPALLAAGIAATGALAAFGSASASAQTYTDIYGSGAALQNQLQNDILLKDWSEGSDVTFTQTTSGGGFKEFGNTGAGLDPAQDEKADPGKESLPPGQLDAYVATDSAPDSTEISSADSAAGSTVENPIYEVTVPMAQTPLDILLSLPANLTLNSGTEVKLSNQLVSELFAGTVPAQTGVNAGYTENTWGAFLVDAGLNGDFTDSDSAGDTKIKIEVRKEGAGTTLNLKQYLFYVDKGLGGGPWESPIKEDETACNGTDEWPTTATIEPCPAGNSTDADEVLAVDANPGTVGYATTGDAASNPDLAGHSPKVFTSTPVESTDPPSVGGTASAEHQILYAQVQDGTTGREETPVYADPEDYTDGVPNGEANIYTGDVHISGSDDGNAVGSWVVPGSLLTGSWAGTRASDPTVYNDTGETTKYYPIVAVAFDLSWSNFKVGNLESDYADPEDAGYTAQQYLEYATAAGEGQTAIGTYGAGSGEDDYYYAPLPENIQADSHDAAELVGG